MCRKEDERRHALAPAAAVQIQHEIHLREDLAHEEIRQTLPNRAFGVARILTVQVEVVLGQRPGVQGPEAADVHAGQQDHPPGHVRRVQLPAHPDHRRGTVELTRMYAGGDQQGPAWTGAVNDDGGHLIIPARPLAGIDLAPVFEPVHGNAQGHPTRFARGDGFAEYMPVVHECSSSKKQSAFAIRGSRPFFAAKTNTPASRDPWSDA